MNKDEISFHINNNSWIQIVQAELTTWKYKANLGAEESLQAFYKEPVRKNIVIFTEKDLCWSLFLIKLKVSDLKTIYFENICEQQLICL